ncbi:MAG: DUF6789 family protein [Bacillota bacterium]
MGLISGAALGFVLWVIDEFTHFRLLRLLLDVSFLPLPLPTASPLVEWTLHMITSFAVCGLFLVIAGQASGRRRLLLGMVTGAAVSLVYIPLVTVTAEPPPQTVWAPVLWLVGHLAYGLVLGLLTQPNTQKP